MHTRRGLGRLRRAVERGQARSKKRIRGRLGTGRWDIAGGASLAEIHKCRN